MSPIPPPDAAPAQRAADLLCHRATPCPLIRRILASASLQEADQLSLAFTVIGEIDELAIPRTVPPERTDRLWEHTCCEAFLAAPGVEGYLELNLSPSTAWAAYTFQSYREGMRPAGESAPSIHVQRAYDRLEVQAQLRLDHRWAGKPLRLGLSMVLEAGSGALSYWALRHPESRPDFHHPDGFTLELAPLSEED